MRERFYVIVLGLVPAVGPFVGCAATPVQGVPPEAAAAPVDETPIADGPRDGGAVNRHPTPVPTPPPPASPPPAVDGWIHLEFDPSYDCGLYAAPKDKLPPAVKWGDCNPLLASTGFTYGSHDERLRRSGPSAGNAAG
jgi:hypothetical protein